MPIRVGTDLLGVSSVSAAIATHGDRYLNRVYTERELADCRTATGVDPERLAARFAAKESTIKVLQPGDEPVPWREIEVARDPAGRVALRLSGAAAELAADAGIAELALSFSHEEGLVSAVVVAEAQTAHQPIGGRPRA